MNSDGMNFQLWRQRREDLMREAEARRLAKTLRPHVEGRPAWTVASVREARRRFVRILEPRRAIGQKTKS